MFAVLSAQSAAALDLKSADIKDGQPIAVEHNYPRCGGKNISPELSWSGVPANARSLALTVIDTAVKPGGWSHWVVVDLPARDGTLARGATGLPPGAHGLASDFGDRVYDGPCPPAGSGVHRYEFTIWALPDATAATSDGSAKIGAWLEQHAVAKARLTGTVTR
jgi:Raf kinase inhibitor-like YbhB/YbcL family protein